MRTRLCHLSTFTAATFYRRQAIENLNSYFDTGFKSAGDADLVLRMLDAGFTMGTLPDTLSLFINSWRKPGPEPFIQFYHPFSMFMWHRLPSLRIFSNMNTKNLEQNRQPLVKSRTIPTGISLHS